MYSSPDFDKSWNAQLNACAPVPLTREPQQCAHVQSKSASRTVRNAEVLPRKAKKSTHECHECTLPIEILKQSWCHQWHATFIKILETHDSLKRIFLFLTTGAFRVLSYMFVLENSTLRPHCFYLHSHIRPKIMPTIKNSFQQCQVSLHWFTS